MVKTGTDLKSASRETPVSSTGQALLAVIGEQQTVIAEQQTVIAELRRRIDEMETRLSTRRPSAGMPGNKPSAKPRQPETKGPRKRRLHGFARRRAEPTRRVIHAPESCPECGTGLSGGWVQRTREVIDIPIVPAEVVEHVFVARMCALCRKRRMSQDSLQGLTMGRRRLGANLMSLMVTLREEGRLPVRVIQWYLRTVHQLRLSVGAIVEATHAAARKAQPAVAATLERIRGSPVVHADETGWRQDGLNGYVWTFSTPTDRYFVRRGRGKGVGDEVLGESFSGVLVSDFYAAYNHYAGLKQRCWVHLLRDIRELEALYPKDAGLSRWAKSVRRLYGRAKAGALLATRGRLVMERRLLSMCRPFSNDPLAPQAKLCRRIERFIKELFVFVSYADVPPDNNAAERSLRHLVVSRKVSGGTRSEQGTDSKMALASLFGSWRANGIDPLSQCRSLLISPQV